MMGKRGFHTGIIITAMGVFFLGLFMVWVGLSLAASTEKKIAAAEVVCKEARKADMASLLEKVIAGCTCQQINAENAGVK